MKIKALFLAIVLTGVVTSPAFAAGGHGRGPWSAPPPWSNGHGKNWHGRGASIVLASGMVPVGQADPRTSVTPSGGSSQSAIACSPLESGWASPLGRSKWVSLQADCRTALAGPSDFSYSTTFSLPTNRPGLSITGQVLADDSVTIQLNGHTILDNAGSLGSPTTFSSNDSTIFTSGTNTLTFIVHNVTGPSGLDYVAAVHPGHGRAFGQRDDDDDDD